MTFSLAYPVQVASRAKPALGALTERVFLLIWDALLGQSTKVSTQAHPSNVSLADSEVAPREDILTRLILHNDFCG